MTVTRMTSPYSQTSFGISAVVLLFGLLNIFVPSNALAVPKGPGGRTCKSSGTTTVNGKEEGTGKDMKCTADYCKYDECVGGLPPAGKCYEKTHYSNVRDCKSAARTQLPQNHITPGQMAPLIQGQPKQPPQRARCFKAEQSGDAASRESSRWNPHLRHRPNQPRHSLNRLNNRVRQNLSRVWQGGIMNQSENP
jgi:hypothetical protein